MGAAVASHAVDPGPGFRRSDWLPDRPELLQHDRPGDGRRSPDRGKLPELFHRLFLFQDPAQYVLAWRGRGDQLPRHRLSGFIFPRAHTKPLARVFAVHGRGATVGERRRSKHRLVSNPEQQRAGQLAAAEVWAGQSAGSAHQQLHGRGHRSGPRAAAVHDPDADHGDPAYRTGARGGVGQSRRRAGANFFRGDAAAEPAWHDRGLAAGLHDGDRRVHHAGDHGRQPRAGDGDIHRPAVPDRPRLCARRDRGGGPDAAGRPAHASGGAVRCATDRCGAMTRVILPAVLTATFVFLLAPIVVVVLASFNGVGVLSFPPRAFTTRWYYEIDPSFYRALWVSLVVGVITVVLAVLLGVPGALGLARGRFRGRDAINAFCLSPLMVPALVTSVALFQFSLLFWDLFGVTIGGPIASLVIGHLTFAIPFVIRSVLASHTRFDHSLEEAAANLGATPLQTFFRVTLPILRPGIASGAIFAFLISLDEVPIALFMGGGDATTLPVKLFTAMEISFGGDILAVASIIVIISTVLMIVLDRVISIERLFATRH